MKYMYYWTKYPERLEGILEDIKRERSLSAAGCGRFVANLYNFELVMLMALIELGEVEERKPEYKEIGKFKSNKDWFSSFYFQKQGYYKRNRISVVSEFIDNYGIENIDEFIEKVMAGYDAVTGKGSDVELDYEDVWR